MARKKQDPELDLDTVVEDLEPDTELDENEDVGEEDDAPKAKSRKKSSRAKRKDPVGVADLLAAASRPVEEAVDENLKEFSEDNEDEPKKAKRASKPRTKLVADDPAPVFAAAAVAIEEEKIVAPKMTKSLDLARPEEDTPAPKGETAGPWNAMKDVSQVMVQNLERISQSMQEIPTKYSGALNDLLKSPVPRATLVTKLALGFSAVALVLSFVSLSLAQSARQSAISARQSVSTEAVVQADRRAARRAERNNEELTRMAKEVARSATAPLAPPPVAPRPAAPLVKEKPPVAPRPVVKTTPRSRTWKPSSAVQHSAVQHSAVAPRTIREARHQAPVAHVTPPARPTATVSTTTVGALQPDAARVKAMNDLARTAPSRRRVIPATQE